MISQEHILDIGNFSLKFWKFAYKNDDTLWGKAVAYIKEKYVMKIDLLDIDIVSKSEKLIDAYKSEIVCFHPPVHP